MAEKYINARGLQCPGPIVELFKVAKASESGDLITIEVTDVGFKKDIEAWCKKTNNQLVSLVEEEGTIKAVIRKG
ncbi:MAG: sulfurtransferase TusA family protein [Clostridiaceae bacterium]|jgi:TusA-related sulfurtransferase|nr:sulfurtransferase TusA family protein [Clostridiaceae bacterium]